MTIEQFSEMFRLRVVLDECGDQIIQGKRGQLYVAGNQLCLMVINGAPVSRKRWTALGGRLRLGDISPNATGQRVQDVWIEGIPLENAGAAIKMVRARQKRVLSPDALDASRRRMLKARESLSGKRFQGLETPSVPEPVGD